MTSFYEEMGDGRFRSLPATGGPWDPSLQHGGPPASLLARAMLRAAGDTGMALSRCSFEILGPVAVDELVVEATVTRPGRRVQMLEGTVTAGDRVAVRGRAWQVAPSAAASGSSGSPPPLPDTETHAPEPWSASGYINAIEWRYAHGGYGIDGPAAAWTRPRIPLVAGEPLDPISRVLLVADSGNGISSSLPLTDWFFINPELTVHFLRPPAGEWVCLDAETHVAEGGAGLARSTLWDADGPVAFGTQGLLVARR